MTERLHFHFSLSCIGEGNGNPLQCSCLENPRDGGACWAAVYWVAQSWTRLTRLSSSSSRMSFEVLSIRYIHFIRVRKYSLFSVLWKGVCEIGIVSFLNIFKVSLVISCEPFSGRKIFNNYCFMHLRLLLFLCLNF